MTTIQVTEAAAEELTVVRDLALKIWPHTFGTILSQEQIKYMLEMMYSLSSLEHQVNEQKNIFLLAKTTDNIYAGFAAYELNYKGSNNCKLHKIYILPEMQGRSIGKLLIDEIKQRAIKNGQQAVLLNVNRYNNAVHFYSKYGFATIAEEDIDIGNGYYMNDFVMELVL